MVFSLVVTICIGQIFIQSFIYSREIETELRNDESFEICVSVISYLIHGPLFRFFYPSTSLYFMYHKLPNDSKHLLLSIWRLVFFFFCSICFIFVLDRFFFWEKKQNKNRLILWKFDVNFMWSLTKTNE